MKQTILFIFLFCSIAVWGQDKSYSINGPIQFYDMNGNPNGYTKYNDTRRYWEYYDAQDRLRKTKAYVSDFRAEYYDSTGKIIGTEVYNEEEKRVNCFVNERRIMDNLNKFFKNRTVVVVAHRLSTVIRADNIIFLDNGKIAEQGNHKELVARRGKYFELIQNQLELEQ